MFGKVLSRAALCVMLILAGIVLVYKGVSAGEVKAADTTSLSASQEGEAITSQIIVNATNYLQMTSCEGIDKAPEIAKPVEPVERMIIDLSEDDIYMLASQVFVEAGAEPYDAQVGVANVIINRIKSDKFPNTLTEVLYEDGQFPPAYNGLLSSAMANGSGEEVMDAVNAALYGESVAGDYLYFNMAAGIDLAICKSYMQIGDTVFYTPIEEW